MQSDPLNDGHLNTTYILYFSFCFVTEFVTAKIIVHSGSAGLGF